MMPCLLWGYENGKLKNMLPLFGRTSIVKLESPKVRKAR